MSHLKEGTKLRRIYLSNGSRFAIGEWDIKSITVSMEVGQMVWALVVGNNSQLVNLALCESVILEE